MKVDIRSLDYRFIAITEELNKLKDAKEKRLAYLGMVSVVESTIGKNENKEQKHDDFCLDMSFECMFDKELYLKSKNTLRALKTYNLNLFLYNDEDPVDIFDILGITQVMDRDLIELISNNPAVITKFYSMLKSIVKYESTDD